MSAITPPNLPPFIINGSGKHKYVMTYKNTWDPEKKRSCRCKGDSKCVGKCLAIEGRPECSELVFKDEFKQ